MCLDPMTMLSVASSVMGFIGQQQEAEAQEEANAIQRQSIIDQTNLRNQELRKEQANEIDALQLENIKKRATARVAAGEAGITGASVDQTLNEIEMNFGQDVANINANKASQIKAGQSSAKAQSHQLKPVKKPSFLATGLQIGGAVYQDPNMSWNKVQRPKVNPLEYAP